MSIAGLLTLRVKFRLPFEAIKICLYLGEQTAGHRIYHKVWHHDFPIVCLVGLCRGHRYQLFYSLFKGAALRGRISFGVRGGRYAADFIFSPLLPYAFAPT